MNLIEQKRILDKVRDEIKEVLINPYKKDHPNEDFELWKTLSYERTEELSYFGMCFSESLRI